MRIIYETVDSVVIELNDLPSNAKNVVIQVADDCLIAVTDVRNFTMRTIEGTLMTPEINLDGTIAYELATRDPFFKGLKFGFDHHWILQTEMTKDELVEKYFELKNTKSSNIKTTEFRAHAIEFAV